MATSSRYSLCTICAIYLNAEPERSTREWQTKHLLVMGPHWNWDKRGPESTTVPDETVVCLEAEAEQFYPSLRILPNGPSVFPQFEYYAGRHPSHNSDESNWYFGVHSACFELARRVVELSKTANIRSIGNLWVTLERRCTRTALDEYFDMSFLPSIPVNKPGEPLRLDLDRYYLPLITIFEPWDQLDESVDTWWEEDPIQIPDLTASIVGNLQDCKFTQSIYPKFTASFESLPQEIKDQILGLIFCEPLTLECNYLMPPHDWKRVFRQIPFLWDLDEAIVTTKTREAEVSGFEWNWEKITRQLMTSVTVAGGPMLTPKTWHYNQVGLQVPGGLMSRRRIWQILEDMYPNDVGMVNDLYDSEEEALDDER